MKRTYFREFDGAYLEDSYFLGITADGANLRLKLALALTTDHPDYAPPLPGEAHCYRVGSLVVERPQIIALVPAKTLSVLTDPDGEIDFGDICLSCSEPDRWHIETEWFNAVLRCERPALVLDVPSQTGG